MGNRNGVWLTRTVRRKPAKERWDRSNLEMVVAVPWRKNEDDPKMDGERLESEVIVMDKEYKEKLEAGEHVPVPKRVYISRSMWRNSDSQLDVWGACHCSAELRDKRIRKVVEDESRRS